MTNFIKARKAKIAASRQARDYDPSEPRLAAGQPGGGEWTSTGQAGMLGRPGGGSAGSRGESWRSAAFASPSVTDKNFTQAHAAIEGDFVHALSAEEAGKWFRKVGIPEAPLRQQSSRGYEGLIAA